MKAMKKGGGTPKAAAPATRVLSKSPGGVAAPIASEGSLRLWPVTGLRPARARSAAQRRRRRQLPSQCAAIWNAPSCLRRSSPMLPADGEAEEGKERVVCSGCYKMKYMDKCQRFLFATGSETCVFRCNCCNSSKANKENIQAYNNLSAAGKNCSLRSAIMS